MKWLKASWYVLITATVLWASGIVQAIVPQIVDAAFRQGPAAASKFSLTTGAFSTGNCRQTAADEGFQQTYIFALRLAP